VKWKWVVCGKIFLFSLDPLGYGLGAMSIMGLREGLWILMKLGWQNGGWKF